MGLAFHLLRNDRAVPPWIAADREARRRAEAVDAVIDAAFRRGRSGRVDTATRARFRARLERALDDHARAVESLNASAPSLHVHRLHLDRPALLARLDEALDGRTANEPAR